MSARWQALRKRYWESRASGERQLIALVALVMFPLLAYVLLWQPAHTALKKLHVSVPEMRSELVRLREQAGEVDMLRHRPQPAVLDANALKLAIIESAQRHQLQAAISTLDAMEPNAVRITMESVAFEQWLRWLRDLQQEQHVRASSLGLAALPQAGMVRINATLSNGAAQ